MAQYVGGNSRGPFYTGGWTDSRNPASGARNPFIEVDPGNPYAQGVGSVGGGSRDPTGMNHQQKQNLGRQSNLDEAYYNAQMDFTNNLPEWANVSQQNQPYYFQQQGVTNQANAARDASIYGSQAGVESTGITTNAALEKAKAEAAALLGQTQLQTGSAERISSGRNDALLGALGGWTNMLGNTLPGMFGGLGNAIGGFGQSVTGNGQNQQQAGFQDPMRRYMEAINNVPSAGPADSLLAKLRGQGQYA